MTRATVEHQSNLDILRGLAVFCVLIHHFLLTVHAHLGRFSEAHRHYLVALGHAGVLAFFVHTSLVLMYSLERLHSSERRVAVSFYIRRAFRIYPLALVAIAVAVLFKVPYKTWDDPQPVSHAVIVANAFLVQNLFTKQQVLGPMWSLPYEVQMYVVLPGLFLLARGRNALLILGTLFLSFCGLGFGIHHYTQHLNMAAYVPCFLAGVLAYSLRARVHGRMHSIWWPAFLLILFTCFLIANRGNEEPTFWSGWVFCLVLAVFANLFRDSNSPTINLVAERLSLYSFGIYLLHPLVLYFIFVYLDVQQVGAALVMLLGLTGLVSIIGFYAIEAPMISLGRRLSSGFHASRAGKLASEAPGP